MPYRKEDDGAIAQAAIDALNWNVSIPQDAVRVTVEDGWVSLEGSVAWFYQRKAENSVRHLKGVKGVSGQDRQVVQLNQQAFNELTCEKRLEIVPGATHLFEEPGTLEQVARLARDWLLTWVVGHPTGVAD
jgi:hypothetical protein